MVLVMWSVHHRHRRILWTGGVHQMVSFYLHHTLHIRFVSKNKPAILTFDLAQDRRMLPHQRVGSRRARPDEDLHRRVAGGQDGLLRDALLRDGGVHSFLKSPL